MTAQDFIYQALRKCGQMRPGYTNNADLLNDGLLEFQAIPEGVRVTRRLPYRPGPVNRTPRPRSRTREVLALSCAQLRVTVDRIAT